MPERPPMVRVRPTSLYHSLTCAAVQALVYLCILTFWGHVVLGTFLAFNICPARCFLMQPEPSVLSAG